MTEDITLRPAERIDGEVPPPEPEPEPDPCPATWVWPFSLVEVALCNLGNWIGQATHLAIQPVVNWIWDAGSWITEQVGYGIEALGASVGGFFADLSVFLTDGLNFLAEQTNSFFTAIGAHLESGFTAISDVLTTIIDTIVTTVTSVTDTVGAALGAHFSSFWTSLTSTIDNTGLIIGQSIDSLFDSVEGLAGDILAGMANALGTVLSGIWTGMSQVAGAVAEVLITTVQIIADAVYVHVVTPLTTMITSAVNAILPGSPDPEIEQASQAITNAMIGLMGRHSAHEGRSPPGLPILLAESGALTAGVIGMYMLTHTISLGLDLAHPIKNPGFKAAIMDIMHTFNTEDVIGPLIQAPIWSSLVVPLRMRYNQIFPYKVPDARWLPQLAAEGVISDETYVEAMSYHAMDSEWAGIMKAGEAAVPFFDDLREMYWRGAINPDQMKEALRFLRYSEDHITGYEQLTELIPGLSDLIRIAVRESYPDATTTAEHFARMKAWLKLQGFSDYWSDALWQAHWIIPTQSQADELLYRGEIDEEMHTALYILNDVDPDYIDLIRKIRWKLPGRIEARWLYKWGFIDQSGLEDLMVKDGMSPDWAPNVAAATARNQMLAEINRMRDNAKKDFGKGYITEEQLTADLSALGYSTTLIEFHIADAISDAQRAMLDSTVDTFGDAYMKDILNEEQLETGLKEYIVRPEVLQAELEHLFIRKYKKPKAS